MLFLRRTLPLLPLLLLLLLTIVPVAAQDTCPEGLACVSYGEHVIEIDPADGPVVSIIVERHTITSETLDGTQTTSTVKGATFVALGGHYLLAAEWDAPAEGVLEDATVGAAYGMTEIASE